MSYKNIFPATTRFTILFCILISIGYSSNVQAFSYFQNAEIQNNINYDEYNGVVVNADTNKPLVSATISLNETNISTITNDEGEFLLKVPKDINNGKITVSFLGYNDKVVSLSSFNNQKIKIELAISVTELSEVNIDPKDPEALIKAVMKRRGANYQNDHTIMTAFYRETIKKRRTYVSLSEAVVDVYKKPYVSDKNDVIKLYRARKSADYKKLDTLTLKLQGGPSSTLYIDVMKNPELLFSEDILKIYQFSFDASTKINNRHIYVLNFKQRPYIKDLYYYGKVYIDAETLALTKAVFSLNLKDKNKASKLFVKRKPARAKVYPTVATYNIDYREKDGKWYYGYGRIDLVFKVNWKKKLFNSTYKLNIEMAITDWKKNIDNENLRPRDRLKSSVVISDEASGFSDPKFWGEYNVIEPEKSIESAIRKIQKQLRKLN
ncbi:carboxypeptidase-like regulatory domain-containing protein [Aquimarina sp. 2201CG14-23]|uniref:carboxypeptidase-like regulatory domain-containing protein n=1 Tax=Aquimarina mycalae TaxID=3040073 RepID=UPI0024781E6B|nr:carboxypeptidase-like regulatory domain-containing protein [Aquimarina sp. 2201CG14-23]MDH7444172.1 carboxypeptidase-like regulatory domain-containing protein [Aquimarina sp. 2201CG14-23]